MKFINITDFTGGIQERLNLEEYSTGQWSRLTGFVPDKGEMRTQWQLQQVGDPADIVRIWPLTSISGTWLVAILNNGSIAYRRVAGGTNLTTGSWTTITNVSNVDNSNTIRSIQASNTYRFVCSVPVQPHKYVVTVDNADPDNPTKDTPGTSTLASVGGSSTTTGVLICNSDDTRYNSNNYAHYNVYVAYVDDLGPENTWQVRVIGFPNQRRLPLHDTNTGDKLKRFDGSSFTNLIRSNPAVDSYPYTYLDIDGQLRPGTGVIPTGTVGVMKNNLLLLGDIYWRSDVANKEADLSDAYLQTTTSTDEIDDQEYQFVWPAGYPTTARVIFNEGPGVLYLKNNTNIRADIIGFTVGTTTIIFETLEAHGYADGDTVEVTGMRENINGVYTASSVTTNTFTVSRTLPGRQITHRASSGTTRTITTQSKHNLVVGQWVGISGLTSDYNGGYQVSSIPTPNSFKYEASPSLTESSTADAGIVDTPYVQVRSLKSEDGFVTVELGDRLQPDPTVRYVHNLYPGDRIHLKDLNGYASIHGVPAALNGVHEVVDTPTSSSFRIRNPYQTALRITQRDFVAGATPTTDPAEITFTTDGEHEFEVGTEVVISGLGSEEFNGRFTIEDIPAGDEFTILVMTERTYSSTKTINRPNALVVGDRMLAASGAASPPYTIPGGLCSISLGRAVSYTPSSPEGKVVPGEYRAIPDSNWTNIYASASLPQTKVKAVRTLNTVYQTLNHTNTGRHRGSMYFATGGEIDTFDPRAVLQIAKGGSTITGMHVIDDNVIVTTSPGSGGGLYRITGYLSRLINYGKANDPNAIRIELLRPGLHTPEFTYGDNTGNFERTIMSNQSVEWEDAGVVAFISSNGELWYTNGVTTGRLDTNGPSNAAGQYSIAGSQLAAVGKHLFYYKKFSNSLNGRLYCLTMTEENGTNGSAIWTEIALPDAAYDPEYSGAFPLTISSVFSMVGTNDSLFFVCDHGVSAGANRYIVYSCNVKNNNNRGTLWSITHNPPEVEELPPADDCEVWASTWPLWLTVVTPPVSGEDNTRLYNWNKFAFNFSSGSSNAWLHTVKAMPGVYHPSYQFSELLGSDIPSGHDFDHLSANFDLSANENLDWGGDAMYKHPLKTGLRQFRYWGQQLHQFVSPVYIGPQVAISFIVTLTGDVTLHSANVWYAGSRPNFVSIRAEGGAIGDGAIVDADCFPLASGPTDPGVVVPVQPSEPDPDPDPDPPVPLLNLDGLALNPKITWENTIGGTGDFIYAGTPNFAVDIFNQTDYPEKIWFFSYDESGSDFILASYNKDTNTTTREWPPVGTSVLHTPMDDFPLLIKAWDWELEEYTNNLYTYDWFYGTGMQILGDGMSHYGLDDDTFLTTQLSPPTGSLYGEATVPYDSEFDFTNFMVLGDPSNEFAPYQMYSNEGDAYGYITNAAPEWHTEIPPLPDQLYDEDEPFKLQRNIIGSGQYLWGITASGTTIKLYTWDWELGFGGVQDGWVEKFTFSSLNEGQSLGSSIAFDFNATVTVSPTTGELFWLQETVVAGSSPTRRVWRLNSWAFDTGVRTTRENIFNTSGDTNNIDSTSNTNTATLQPTGVFSSKNIRMTAGGVPGEDGFLAIRGDTCAEALGYPQNQNSYGSRKLKVPVIWTIKGSGATLPAQATLLTHPDLSITPTIPDFLSSWGFESFGGIQALATDNKLYTWVGRNFRGLDLTYNQGSLYYIQLLDSRIREWEV